MNQEEYRAWESDADVALSGRYVHAERKIILDWFRSIKGADERDLIGHEAVEAMLVFVCAQGKHDLYNSLMARAFIYAPFILEEAKAQSALPR